MARIWIGATRLEYFPGAMQLLSCADGRCVDVNESVAWVRLLECQGLAHPAEPVSVCSDVNQM